MRERASGYFRVYAKLLVRIVLCVEEWKTKGQQKAFMPCYEDASNFYIFGRSLMDTLRDSAAETMSDMRDLSTLQSHQK